MSILPGMTKRPGEVRQQRDKAQADAREAQATAARRGELLGMWLKDTGNECWCGEMEPGAPCTPCQTRAELSGGDDER